MVVVAVLPLTVFFSGSVSESASGSNPPAGLVLINSDRVEGLGASQVLSSPLTPTLSRKIGEGEECRHTSIAVFCCLSLSMSIV